MYQSPFLVKNTQRYLLTRNKIKRRQIMTVQELIDKLNGIEDKDVDVFLDSGDINLWNANEVYIDDDKTIVIIAN